MRLDHGFTIIELMTAVAIVGVLATLGHAGFESMFEKSNFRTMREFGVELALNQQLHRQRFGRYAKEIKGTGTPTPTQLVMPTANNYNVVISQADFRGYHAEVTPNARPPIRLPDECRTVLVQSNMGRQSFGAKSSTNQDTSNRCIPNG